MSSPESSHLNPSRRKIPSTTRNPESSNSSQKLYRSGSISDTQIKRCLFGQTDKQIDMGLSTTALIDENNQLRAQIQRFQELNQRLNRHIDSRDRHLTQLNNKFRELLLQYNQQLSKMNEELYRQLQQSRKTQEISYIKAEGTNESMEDEASLFLIKQTLDCLEFPNAQPDILTKF